MPRMKFPAHLLVALALSRVFVHLGRLFVFTKDGANAYNCSFISQALANLNAIAGSTHDS